MRRFGPFVALVCLLMTSTYAMAVPRDLARERADYLAALRELKTGHKRAFLKLLQRERSYVLYPYLQYHDLNDELSQVAPREIEAFLRAHRGTPVAEQLRRHYVKTLAAHGQWGLFLANYRAADASPRLRCLYWDQEWRRTRNHQGLDLQITRFWKQGTPLPQACRGFFLTWVRQQPNPSALIWGRIRSAMRHGSLSVARHLRPLLAVRDRLWVDRWIDAYLHPVRALTAINYPVHTQLAREIIRDGVIQIGYRDPVVAMSEWIRLRHHYTFFGEDNNDVLRHLGVLAAQDHLPQAVSWLSNAVPHRGDDLRVREWRVRAALWAGDWARVAAFIQTLPPNERARSEWRYWQARAKAQLHHPREADALYRGLARHRGYYGFLSADRLGRAYVMNVVNIPASRTALQGIASRPAVAIAHELFRLNQVKDARAEWNFAMRALPHRLLVPAAVLAARWGWYDRAIATINAAGDHDDLALRFPVAYRVLVEAVARLNGIDPGWIYGIMRQESAFMVDAESRAGALGLMQLMPFTGRRTARLLGLHLGGNSGLLDVDNNVRLGARYLKEVLDDNQGDVVLATASYNAGPDRVAAWRPSRHARAADVWIDNIPYTETRDYVKHVLGFTTVYDYLLGATKPDLRPRMSQVPPVALRN
ncbi:MAG: transglycosylase SLT domain-containing protein [Acidiferrobacteraceae bacterium]